MALSALTVALALGAAPAAAGNAATPITFGRETVADPFRLSFEPSVAVSPDGTIYESPIFGFKTTMSYIQRSDDGGQTFNVLGIPGIGKISHCTGGGDSDIATSPVNDLYMFDLGDLPEVPAHVSNDHGNNFTSSCLDNITSGGINGFADRQWLSTDTVHGLEWYIYNDATAHVNTGNPDIDNHGESEYVWSAPLATAPGTAGNAQLALTSLCKDVLGRPMGCASNLHISGGASTDNFSSRKGNTYVPVGSSPPGTSENDVTLLVINPTATNKVIERVVAKNTKPILFPAAAVDRAGNLYYSWVDDTDFQLRFTSSKDLGKTWTKPVVITGPTKPFKGAVMPWLTAGDDGRVDLAFYGTPLAGDPSKNVGPWDGWMLQSLDATRPNPTFTATKFTDRPNHKGGVCLLGLVGCSVPGGGTDRELGDFFKIALDRDGRAVISFADGNNQLGAEAPGGAQTPSMASFVRQATGPSLFTSVGDVPPVAAPANEVKRGLHHNPIPFSGASGPGPDADALNLVGSKTAYKEDGLQVVLTVKNLDAAAALSQSGQNVATYLTRWWYNGRLYYAAAEYSATGSWSFFAGEPAPVLDGLEQVGYAYHPAGPAITGTVKPGLNGTITLKMHLSDVGNPKPGDRLYSVTSWALVHALPSAPTPPTASNFTDFPQVADAMPAYNVEKPSAVRVPVPAVTPSVQPPANLPSTLASAPGQLPAGIAAFLALVGVAALGTRRGRRRS